MKRTTLTVTLALMIGAGAGLSWSLLPESVQDIPLRLNKEDLDEKGNALNPSTQSVNRYSSELEHITRLRSLEISEAGTRLEMNLDDGNDSRSVQFRNVDYYQLVPLLPYAVKGRALDDFDKANLMLGEFARNGLALSYQTENSHLGYFNDLQKPFFAGNGEEDYVVMDGAVAPRPKTRPKRFSIINNCLNAGLWELSAIDGVGEMYHAWFDMPKHLYVEMIRRANGIEASDSELAGALRYKRDLTSVIADLDRLRTPGETLFKGRARVVASKEIGGYSTQESRQKSQQRYFEVSRGLTLSGDTIKVDAKRFADLSDGDLFSMRRFVAPGIYSAKERKTVPFDPEWEDVEVTAVRPLTAFRDGKAAGAEDRYIELSIFSKDRQRRFVVGNVPVALLVEQEDYLVPAFGVGVSPPWEFVERRFLRMKDGPPPNYAYQLVSRSGTWRVENNHEGGVEQIALRVVPRGGKTYLRVTLIAYERILDLLELEVEVPGRLAEELRASSARYRPPLFRVYDDPNIL